MKILVTGAKGFIAKNLIPALSDHRVIGCDRDDALPNLSDFDWVIHLGAITSTTETDVELVLKQNLDYSVDLLDRCIANNVNLQYASSASVYGVSKDFAESAAVNPRSPYAWSKYLFDRHVLDKLKNLNQSDPRIQGFRYFNVYGPHEDHKGDQASPYHKFVQQAITTGKIQLFQQSDSYFRDFVPVNKVIETHLEFFDVKESGIWNIGTGQPKSFEQIAREIADKFSAVIEYIDMPHSLRLQYQAYTCANLTKLTKTLHEKNSS